LDIPCPLPVVLPPFVFHAPSPSHTYSLSLHDALPISGSVPRFEPAAMPRRDGGPLVQFRRLMPECESVPGSFGAQPRLPWLAQQDRKSTRLNSSHVSISYAVFCLKKKNIRIVYGTINL